jgi:hypothetical protein
LNPCHCLGQHGLPRESLADAFQMACCLRHLRHQGLLDLGCYQDRHLPSVSLEQEALSRPNSVPSPQGAGHQVNHLCSSLCPGSFSYDAGSCSFSLSCSYPYYKRMRGSYRFGFSCWLFGCIGFCWSSFGFVSSGGVLDRL